MEKLKTFDVPLIFFRYLFILLVGLGNLRVFYWIFSGPTINVTYFFLHLISPSSILFRDSILFNSVYITLSQACIAGSAYYLLFILVFSLPKMKVIKRIVLLCSLYGIFFMINVIRIVTFANFAEGKLFNTLHLFSWYFLSTLLIIFIWFLVLKTFKVKGVPFYSDFHFISNLNKRKNSKRSKKN